MVYFDESGFLHHTHRPHAWALRGKKVYADIPGNNRKRTNLIMAQRGKEWLAPMLFEASCTHHTVTTWIKQCLIKELNEPSLIIMDNAPFHNKTHIREALEAEGHTLLPLPTYSPDFNPIEQSFGVIKKRRIYNNLTLEQIIGNSYLE